MRRINLGWRLRLRFKDFGDGVPRIDSAYIEDCFSLRCFGVSVFTWTKWVREVGLWEIAMKSLGESISRETECQK